MPVALVALWLSFASAAAGAVQVSSLTPQGEVARVRQVVARFDEAAVKFGDATAAAPLSVSCSDAQAAKGSGRWLNEKQWVFDFENDLPPGVRCTVTRSAGFTVPGGQPLVGTASWRFNTGGPFVRSIRPGGGTIDEEQIFLLQLNGAATPQSVRDNVWCAAEGLGERIPVNLIEGEQRAALLQSSGLTEAAAKDPQRFLTLQCRRSLAPASRVTLVYGQGVATPSGVANRVEKRYDYKVREPFAASFTCERENAQAGCLPLKPMELRFNAPVPRQLAAQIVLRANSTGGKTATPTFEQGNEAQADALVDSVKFAPPFAEQASYTIEVPSGFQDASARPLGEPGRFPMKVSTGAMPPLAKFAASPFGVIERLAEPGGVAMMPVTVRRVEPALAVQAYTPGQVSDVSPRTDAEIIAWSRKLQRYEARQVPRKKAREDVKGPLPKVLEPEEKDWVQSRMLSLLAGQNGVKTLDMPKAQDDPRPFEVVGIPLTPGFHVLEIASQRLGESLLDARYGSGRTMYVRTSALATNLAVHFKLGRENSLAWVTTLDKGQVVAGAKVRVSNCRGEELATAVTDASGVARFEAARISSEAPTCSGGDDDGEWRNAYFVSARATDAKGVEDLAFTWSDWQRGIEPWRFNLPTSSQTQPDRVAHTVFDRMLFRAGETVSMKHVLRTQNQGGFGLPKEWPQTLVITHVGSGQQFKQKLEWRSTAGGGRSSESSFAIAPAAKLGLYQVELAEGPADAPTRTWSSGQFRVEEFRLPVMEGRIGPVDGKKPLVATSSLPTAVQVNYVAGGGASGLPVRVSALVKPKWVDFADYDGFSFSPPQKSNETEGDAQDSSDEGARVVADKLPLTLDRSGAGQVVIEPIAAAPAPRELLLEASYADPNGEVQTLRSTQTLWPSQVVAGLKTEGWASVGQKIRFQALALDLSGKAQPDVAVEVKAISRITTTSRKRMVGGFYTYDNKTETKDLGTVCSGKSDSRGLLLCEAKLSDPGQVELVATAKDAQGRPSVAATSVYVTRQGELWFGGEDHDRIDLLPEKKNYQPGETAKFQVRMPFRFATALVSVEREGIVETQVVQLNGQDPTVQLQVKDSWGPNVYVSVLALRGRLREVPWYSFFTWGFKSPREWWTAFWYEGREYVAPTAMVDLSKPAYRLGATEIRVGSQAHQIALKVASDQPSYTVRGQAQITLTGTLPDGKPAANAEVAVAVVDQALLELMPNTSWNLQDAMLARRSWGVSTSTAQMEIVGRRHYGRKAVPAGGGGGKSATRELLDTLLLWNPRVVLDANGQARITVPLNDALTTFRIAAVAELGTGLFGTGEARIQTTQDLQIISGLPPLVREDDEFRAQITLRNTTTKAMKVQATPRATLLTLEPQTVDIPAGEAREVAWSVKAPAQLAATRAEAILWEIEAHDTSGNDKARDALKVSQRIVPAVPVTVQQANLVQLDAAAPLALDVGAPAGALPGRGGLRLALQPSLGTSLPGVRDWFANYPYACLEQKTSKAIGLRDAKMWKSVVAQMPAYLDNDGLASYFPPQGGSADSGSDTLTAYLLAATSEAATLDPALALPDELRAQMEAGLVAFVEGRLERKFWSPRQDMDVRKLAALEALSRSGKAQGRMTTSITIAPNQWPTGAVLDWIGILKRVKDVPQREQRLAEAEQVLKARVSYQGTRLVFSTESDDNWWWLMSGADVNTNRMLLAAVDDPAWKEDMGKLVAGALARQQRNGAWSTTTANLWGSLALEKFSRAFESAPVQGTTHATLSATGAGDIAVATGSIDWREVKPSSDPAAPALRNNTLAFAWQAQSKAEKEVLRVRHEGGGKPWLTLQSTAAVPLTAPVAAGYTLKKTVTPVEQAKAGRLSRGDVLRVSLEINATADMTWVAVTDPIAGGSAILGSGLGRDSQIATQGENKKDAGRAWPAFEERSFEAFRAYYEYLPKGVSKIEYTVRLNNVGDFALPPSRVEALYAPEMFGMVPNARMKVEPGQ
ncbi:MAG: alpha-2-macroglobulin [Proteobacteria bacterium]|nr:alpha-2-macroglobulin [Pseudomonadota bacterium]